MARRAWSALVCGLWPGVAGLLVFFVVFGGVVVFVWFGAVGGFDGGGLGFGLVVLGGEEGGECEFGCAEVAEGGEGGVGALGEG